MAAATPAERERTRQMIRGLASAGRLESFQRYQKDHPNEALQGLLNLYRDKLDAARPHTGTIQGGQ
jgi:hypothetical protein